MSLLGLDHPDKATFGIPSAQSSEEFEIFVIGGRSEQTGQKSQMEPCGGTESPRI